MDSKNIFIDTNILIDLLCHREHSAEAATVILHRRQRQDNQALPPPPAQPKEDRHRQPRLLQLPRLHAD